MSICPKCGEHVYFAERRTSLGKEWHRWCLRCEECGKVLHPGQHAEHKGVPFCHIPCYTALFGPTVYGHGSAVEAHSNFGRMAERKLPGSPVKRSPSELQSRVLHYNDYHEGTNCVLKSKEVNGRLVLEGLLRVYWGVYRPIHLKPNDESPPPSHWRHSYHLAMLNGMDSQNTRRVDQDLKDRRSSMDDLYIQRQDKEMTNGHAAILRYNTVSYRSEGKRRRINRQKRLSIINGHLYNLETSVFIPAYGSVTSVRINSLDPAPEVIRLLLDKFKVENNPVDFCLCILKSSGEIRLLEEPDYPLLERVLLGPLDEDKIFLMEKDRAREVSEEVAHYMSLPDPVLRGFLQKFREEEEEELKFVKARYARCRQLMEEQLAELSLE